MVPLSGIFRAEVVGSLLRSESLKLARAEWVAGKLSTSQFKAVEDHAVDEAIALQEAAGLDVVTDGELRRGVFIDSFAAAVDGVSYMPEPGQQPRWHGGVEDMEVVEAAMPVVTGRIQSRRSLVTEEFTYARARATQPIKVTLPSPMTLGLLWDPLYSQQVYSDVWEFFKDASVVLRREVEALAALGCEYVQVDAPDLAKLVDDDGRAFYAAMGAEPQQILTEGIDLLNSIVEGVGGVRFGIHLCRGNSQGRWRSSGGYEAISSQVFRRATAYDIFLLEYDDERSGGFEPLADLPDEKLAVLGLLTTKRPILEDISKLEARIREAAQFHPLEQLALSPQCGFASEVAGNPLSLCHQQAKLRRVAEVARRVW